LFDFRFRSTNGLWLTIFGLALVGFPLLLYFTGGSAFGYMLAFYAAVLGRWAIWLTIVVGFLFLALAVFLELAARR